MRQGQGGVGPVAGPVQVAGVGVHDGEVAQRLRLAADVANLPVEGNG